MRHLVRNLCIKINYFFSYPYSERVLLGLLISVGGVTERLVRQSSLCVFKELESMNSGQLTDFGQMLIKIFKVST